MDFKNQQLQAFLIQAELINEKVKALAQNKISPEQFDRLEKLREQDKQKREQVKIKRQQQIINKKKLGTEGKGITKDFKNFCKFCRLQYELQTPICLKCNRKTMTLSQRQSQLQTMVTIYKDKKKDRQNRKHRWEMWQKTQASVSSQNPINYSKWEYFVSDSEEQPDKEPILPKNDPNFMALQADMEQRKKRKQKDQEQTKRLKQKGNKLMEQGNYEQAMHKYTLSLQHAKDVKSVYTNRALAYIKLGKFKKAVKDCTNVIEYMEIFQKIGQNKSLTFKAYSRRALARKQLKDYRDALTDIDQALKLYPQDKAGLLLKKQIQGLKDHSEKVQKILRQTAEKQQSLRQGQNGVQPQSQVQQKSASNANNQAEQLDMQGLAQQQRQIVKKLAQQSLAKQKPVQGSQKPNEQVSPIERIKRNIQDFTPQAVGDTFDLLIKQQDMRAVFVAAKGIESCLKILLTSEYSNKEAMIVTFCMQGNGAGQKAVWDYGVDKIHTRILNLLNDTTNQKSHVYQVIEDLFEILIALSLYEGYRIKLSNDQSAQKFVEAAYTKLISKKKNKVSILNLLIMYMSNLLSGNDSGLKNNLFTKQKVIILLDSFFVMVLDEKSSNRGLLDLKKNIFGLIANLATHTEHRKTISQFFQKNSKFAELSFELQQYPKSAHNFNEYVQSILSIFVNITFQSTFQLPELSQILFSRFIKNRKSYSKEIIYRSLVILSRLKYTKNIDTTKKWLSTFQQIALQEKPLANPNEKNNMIQIVKLLNILYTPNDGVCLTAQIPKKLFGVMKGYIKGNLVHENLFCNTANLFGIIAVSQNPSKQDVFDCVSEEMKQLVYISKQKIGNWRKNAAILIAKCSSNPKCRQAMEKEHAMDVLKSIAHLIQGR